MGQLLVQHAQAFSQEPDGGEEHLRNAFQHMGGNGDSATSPAQALQLPRYLPPEKEHAPFQLVDRPFQVSTPLLYNCLPVPRSA